MSGSWILEGLRYYSSVNCKPDNGCELQTLCDGQSGAMLRIEMVKTAKAMYRKEIMERRRLHNMVLELRGNIRVFCRVRPLEDPATLPIVQFPHADQLMLVNPETYSPSSD